MENNGMTKTENKLLESIHEQFAINHNKQQELFIKLLIALLALFGGYGAVWSNVHCNPFSTSYIEIASLKVCVDEGSLWACALVVCIILSYLTLILINNGWSFRKAQIVNNAIRKAFLCSKNQGERCSCDDRSSCTNLYYLIFYKHKYGTSSNTMPGFYAISAFTLSSLKFLVFLSLCYSERVLRSESVLFYSFIGILTAGEYLYYENKQLESDKISSRICCCKLLFFLIVFFIPTVLFFIFS